MTSNERFSSLVSHLPLPLLIQLVTFYKKTKKTVSKINQYKIELDKKGIPYVKYGKISGKHIGKQRNPVAVSQYALMYYENFKEKKNNEQKKYLLNCADWILENGVKNIDSIFLEYNFPWPKYNLEKPWRSGMAQGQSIQALVKAHEVSKETKYLNFAKLLLNAFYIEVKDGGVTYKNNEGWWYEEFASKNGPNSKVLNGMIFAMLGIYEYYKYTNDENAKLLFEKGRDALIKELPKFDNKGFSNYDLLGNLSRHYHQVHIDLLEKLYSITKDKIFMEYCEKWKKTNYYKFTAEKIKFSK